MCNRRPLTSRHFSPRAQFLSSARAVAGQLVDRAAGLSSSERLKGADFDNLFGWRDDSDDNAHPAASRKSAIRFLTIESSSSGTFSSNLSGGCAISTIDGTLEATWDNTLELARLADTMNSKRWFLSADGRALAASLISTDRVLRHSLGRPE